MKPHVAIATTLLAAACGSSETPVERPAPSAEEEREAAAPAAGTLDSPAPIARAELGSPAPDFTLRGTDGEEVTLSTFRGKKVILEWFNPGCPFVVYAHSDEAGPIRAMKERVGDELAWLAINSGAPGKQGHGLEVNREAAESWTIPYPILLDEDGTVGQAYEARTTPHMYIVDEEGNLVYRGGLDNAPRGKVPEEGLVNYVDKALADLAAGRDVELAETQPYGCSVKYAD